MFNISPVLGSLFVDMYELQKGRMFDGVIDLCFEKREQGSISVFSTGISLAQPFTTLQNVIIYANRIQIDR